MTGKPEIHGLAIEIRQLGNDVIPERRISGGAVVSFEVKGGREDAWKVVDSTRMISITANLGDHSSR